MSETTSESCSLHRLHAPKNLTVELHHVIPVAWQQFWKPPLPYPFPGKDPRGPLWDARTVPICPTGHRNVHHWIVAMMHALGPSGDPLFAYEAVNGSGKQFLAAYLALTRYVAIGGDLRDLAAAHEWGQA